MKKNKDILKIILVTLIAIFLMVGIAALLLAGHKRSVKEEQKKQEAQDALERVPTVAPTVAVTVTPTPTPKPTVTPTPTPVPTLKPAFNPDDYWNEWYSTDGLAAVDIYSVSEKSVSFYFSQANKKGTRVSEADVTAEVAGNAAKFSFTDSFGSTAQGNFIFDNGQLYVKISTSEQAEGASVSPNVDCIMTRERRQQETAPVETPVPEPTVTPLPEGNQGQDTTQSGDYYFPESDSRYLTDEELAEYSSSDLELAKNEIYARHGRKFMTERIADYFNSKAWYQGTIDPETFDAEADSIFNEYEAANITKIAEWEQKNRNNEN